jgi:tetratricopeptide (TPR) repeat protein
MQIDKWTHCLSLCVGAFCFFAMPQAEAQDSAPQAVEHNKTGSSEIDMKIVAEDYEEAEQYKNVGEFSKALEIYKGFKLKGIEYPELDAKISNVLFRLGRKEDSLAALEEALKSQRKDAELLFNKGVILYSMNRYSESLEAYNSSIEFDPRDELTWHNKGLTLNRLGRHQDAADAYNTALSIKPDFFSARYNLFLSQVASGQFRLATRLIDLIVREYPDRLDAHVARGEFLMTQGQWQKAEASFRVAISFNPEIASLWRQIGICRAQSGDYEAAIESYDKALLLKPEWSEAQKEKIENERLLDEKEN